jgi:hypothetical protein
MPVPPHALREGEHIRDWIMPVIRRLWVFPLFLLLFPFFFQAGCLGECRVDFSNRTGKTVRAGSLDVGGQHFDLSGMIPGESRAFSCKITARQVFNYGIELTLADGRRTTSSIGPAQRGPGCRDSLAVEKDKLMLESREDRGGCGAHRSVFSQEKPLKWISVR